VGKKNSAKIPRKTQPTLQKTSAHQLPEEKEKEKYIYIQPDPIQNAPLN